MGSSGNCLRAFILSCNEFSEAVSRKCDVLQFADDTRTLRHGKNEANYMLKTEDALNNTDQYMKQNRLTLNKEKTELMVFRNEKLSIIQNVNFKGHRLEASGKCIYLGVIFDKEQTYQNQIKKLSLKWLLQSDLHSWFVIKFPKNDNQYC